MTDNLSPRLERLRVELANSIPCSAADRPALLAKRINDVIIDYLTWKRAWCAHGSVQLTYGLKS